MKYESRFRVEITVEAEEAGKIPPTINELMLMVARDKVVPIAYEIGQAGGTVHGRLEIEEVGEVRFGDLTLDPLSKLN